MKNPAKQIPALSDNDFESVEAAKKRKYSESAKTTKILNKHKSNPKKASDKTAKHTQDNKEIVLSPQWELKQRTAKVTLSTFTTDGLRRNVEIFSQELHESNCGTHVRDIEHA